MRRMVALSWVDLRNITRDAMLLGVVCGPLVIALGLRFGLPFAKWWVWETFGVDLAVHEPLIIGMMLQMVPLLIGMLTGFLILDERDEGVLEFIAVTPLSKTGYLFYRLGSPVLLNVLLSLLVLTVSGMTAVSVGTAVPMVLLLGLEAPIIALFLAALAGNKVEGMALAKVTSVLLLAPLIAYFLESEWRLLAGVLPSYWVMEAFLASDAGEMKRYGLYTAVGAVYHGGLLLLLVGRFGKKSR